MNFYSPFAHPVDSNLHNPFKTRLSALGGGEISNPIPSGLLAEYRFDEGSGTQLTDYSPNANHGTLVGSPAWQSGGGLTCTGTQRVTLPSAVFATAKTVIFACAKPGSGNAALGGSNDSPGLLLNCTNSQLNTIVAGVGYKTLATKPTYGEQLLTAVLDASADRLYYSDVELAYSSQSGSLAEVRTNPIIGNGSASALPFGVPIYFALFYSDQLTVPQITQLESYVRQRLSAQSGLAQRVLFDGNSLVEGTTNPTPADRFYDKTLLLLNGSPDTANIGVGGQQTGSIVTNTNAYPYYSIRRPKNIYLLWEITNDLALGSVSTATARTNIISACQQQRDRGSLVAVMTCLPRSDTGNFTEANRQTVNASLLADFPTSLGNRLYTGASYADVLIDVGSNPIIGVAGANTSLTYYNADQVHLIAAGNDFAATDAAAGINYLLAL